jgi:hypothetical protein
MWTSAVGKARGALVGIRGCSGPMQERSKVASYLALHLFSGAANSHSHSHSHTRTFTYPPLSIDSTHLSSPFLIFPPPSATPHPTQHNTPITSWLQAKRSPITCCGEAASLVNNANCIAAQPAYANSRPEGLDPVMEQYNASLPYDRLFYAQDIAGSIAFARANKNNGILTDAEFAAIEKGFAQIKEEWASNSFEVKANDEDIHTANERRLSEIIGKDIGGKLHTGRSRNEQVATDMRLWLREQLHTLEDYLKLLIQTSVQRAEAEIDVLVR